jgi:hypothetical protein
LDHCGVRSRLPVRARDFWSPLRPDRLCGTTSFLCNGTEGSELSVKRPRRKVHHTPPSSDEVENGTVIPQLPKAWCLSKHRDFAFTTFTSGGTKYYSCSSLVQHCTSDIPKYYSCSSLVQHYTSQITKDYLYSSLVQHYTSQITNN